MPTNAVDVAAELERLRADPEVARAESWLRQAVSRVLDTQVELSEIPAPPFREGARGLRVAEMMRAVGLEDVHVDEVGNVLGRLRAPSRGAPASERPGRPGAPGSPAEPEPATPDAGHGADGSAPLVVSAHLDTVFPVGTDVTVHREGDLLKGPGISDDARGLATLLALAEALVTGRLDTGVDLLFAATVGEEGPGDLRGVKHLFSTAGATRGAIGFVSLDGAGLRRIVTRGLGSRRFRIIAQGPGGHSWVDWGLPNPIHHLSALAARLTEIPLQRDPRTTLTIARWAGGKSINAIPEEAWIEVDTRSADPQSLARLEEEVRRRLADAAAGAPPELRMELVPIGLRPPGATPDDALLVRSAFAATRALGTEPEKATSSTDANLPMSLGIPAITMGCGGLAGQAHTKREWYRDVGGGDGLVRAFLTVLATGRLGTS